MCLNVDSTVSTFCANVDIVNQCRVSLRWIFSLYPSINCMTSITFLIQEILFIFLTYTSKLTALRRTNNARVPWVFEIIALNTSDATSIQSRFYVCYLMYQKLLSVWSFKYKGTVVVRIM